MRPEDTSKRDPIVHAMGSGLLDGQDRLSSYITGMEADGQRQLVASSVMPVQSNWDELRAMGFVPGPELDDPAQRTDKLFVSCDLPPGWTREGSSHAMWSKVLDERGVERVAVFYKAAYYDRSAHATILSPARDVVSVLVYREEDADGRKEPLPERPPFPYEVLTERERAELPKVVAGYEDRAMEMLSYPHVVGNPEARKTYDDRLVEMGQIRELLGLEPRS